MVATLPRVPNANCQNLAGLQPESLHWSFNVLQHLASPLPTSHLSMPLSSCKVDIYISHSLISWNILKINRTVLGVG
jgi:hypothetical protein